ncbi:hypothetical protein, partial [Methyloceanibacter sp.]|uniref:hypothetical protein n=1 Tax=Methyloceanibacter sp. TaxID=1965321 RepID=UPI002D5DC3B4
VVGWHHDILEGSDKLWMRVKDAPNRYTNRDKKHRIVAAYFDRQRWFLPTNKGFSGLFRHERSLLEGEIGEVRTSNSGIGKIQEVVWEPKKKYRWVERRVQLSAMALRPAEREREDYFIILATLQAG